MLCFVSHDLADPIDVYYVLIVNVFQVILRSMIMASCSVVFINVSLMSKSYLRIDW